jgi:hypothetical protein
MYKLSKRNFSGRSRECEWVTTSINSHLKFKILTSKSALPPGFPVSVDGPTVNLVYKPQTSAISVSF